MSKGKYFAAVLSDYTCLKFDKKCNRINRENEYFVTFKHVDETNKERVLCFIPKSLIRRTVLMGG